MAKVRDRKFTLTTAFQSVLDPSFKRDITALKNFFDDVEEGGRKAQDAAKGVDSLGRESESLRRVLGPGFQKQVKEIAELSDQVDKLESSGRSTNLTRYFRDLIPKETADEVKKLARDFDQLEEAADVQTGSGLTRLFQGLQKARQPAQGLFSDLRQVFTGLPRGASQAGLLARALNAVAAAARVSGRLMRLLTSPARIASRAFAALRRSSRRLSFTLIALRSALVSTRSAIGGVVLILAGRELIQVADQLTNIQNRLRLVTEDSAELNRVTTQLFRTAQQTRTSFDTVVDTYFRVARATDRAVFSQERLLEVSKAISQAAILGGGNTTSINSAIIQFGQIVGSSDVSAAAQELNSIREQTPRLFQAILQGFGRTRNELLRDIEEGKIQAVDFLVAIESQAEKLRGEYANFTPTIGQSFTVLGNSASRFIGILSGSTGAGDTFSKFILRISQEIDDLTDTLDDRVEKIRGALSLALGPTDTAQRREARTALVDAAKAAGELLYDQAKGAGEILVAVIREGLTAFLATVLPALSDALRDLASDIFPPGLRPKQSLAGKAATARQQVEDLKKELIGLESNPNERLGQIVTESQGFLKPGGIIDIYAKDRIPDVTAALAKAEKNAEALNNQLSLSAGSRSAAFFNSIQAGVEGVQNTIDRVKSRRPELIEAVNDTLNALPEAAARPARQVAEEVESVFDRAITLISESSEKLVAAVRENAVKEAARLEDLARLAAARGDTRGAERLRLEAKLNRELAEASQDRLATLLPLMQAERDRFALDTRRLELLDNLQKKIKQLRDDEERRERDVDTGEISKFEARELNQTGRQDLLADAERAREVLESLRGEGGEFNIIIDESIAKIDDLIGGLRGLGDIGEKTFAEGLSDSFGRTVDELGDVEKAGRAAGARLAEGIAGIGDVMVDVISGAKSAKEAFRDWASSLLSDLARIIARMAILNLVKSVGNSFGFGIGDAAAAGANAATPNKGGLIVRLANGAARAVRRYSTGGYVPGGGPDRDSVPAWLTTQEFVLRRSAVKKYGVDYLNRLNAGLVSPAVASMNSTMGKIGGAAQKLNTGGLVGPAGGGGGGMVVVPVHYSDDGASGEAAARSMGDHVLRYLADNRSRELAEIVNRGAGR